MIRPGPRNLITDVDGLRVGNAQLDDAWTGTTVVLPDEDAVTAADVRGGAPGTHEINALDPTCSVEAIQAIVLSGGSAFGLDAASGVSSWLLNEGRGVQVGSATIPVVPAAILIDLLNGGDKDWGDVPPYRELAIRACDAAGTDFQLGNVGAGMGATAGLLKGGLGSASALSDEGEQVGALMAVNPWGSVVMPGTDAFWAWPWEVDGEFGGARPTPEASAGNLDYKPKAMQFGPANTTIGVVATNVALTKAQALRIAIMAHDGIARAIRPVHTPFDGDTIFVLSTARQDLPDPVPLSLARLGMMAADCVARAIARGVYAADGLGDFPGYRERHAG